MELIFAKLARAEMAEARRYYDMQQRGLGNEFVREASLAAKRILEQPLAWQIEQAPVRRFLFNRFPYKDALCRIRSTHRRVGGRASTPKPGLLDRAPLRCLTAAAILN